MCINLIYLKHRKHTRFKHLLQILIVINCIIVSIYVIALIKLFVITYKIYD